jgi:hypothetical protein
MTLSSGLQQLADTINDTSGKQSDAQRIDPYSQAYNAVTSFVTSEYGITHEQSLEWEKFQRVIADSDIGKAAAGGELQLNGFESRHAGIEGSQRGEFYASLSSLQKKLPQFTDLGRSFDDLMKEKAIAVRNLESYRQHQDAALLEAQILFGSNRDAGISDSASSKSASPNRVGISV